MNPKIIVLGIFQHLCASNYRIYNIFPFKGLVYEDLNVELPFIMDVVKVALSRCDKCYFILDGIFTPITDKSVTCKELQYILDNPLLLDKVQFVLSNVEISLTEAFRHLNIPTVNPSI